MSARDQDKELKRYLRGDTIISRAYRAAADSEPPAHLDRAIQAAARRAAFGPSGRQWAMPVAAAAVLVLAVGLVTFLSREGVPLSPGETGRGLPAETADKREAARPETRGAGEPPAMRRAVTSESKRAPLEEHETLAAEARKRSETAATRERPPGRVATDEVAVSKARATDSETAPGAARPTPPREGAAAAVAPSSAAATILADVLSVSTSGTPGAYQFTVTVRSPDTGCQQYADWWEVLSEDGRLLYRRVLLHSHVEEQPFTRSGGPVPIGPDTVVWVRAHLHPSGYGGGAMRGSVRLGFRSAALAASFGAQLAQQPPLPGGCDF